MDKSDVELIREEAERRGISRLCHLTLSKNLPHILLHLNGIFSVRWMQGNAPDLLDRMDKQRFDGQLNHISCSIEYPNVWYLQKARIRRETFKDWVAVLIKPDVLWREGTLFCVRNCATENGNLTKYGYDGFMQLFKYETSGTGGQIFRRTDKFLPCCPTDAQAEVMVYESVDLDLIMGIAVQNLEQVDSESKKLELLQVSSDVLERLRWVVAPQIFTNAWPQMVRNGKYPSEDVVR